MPSPLHLYFFPLTLPLAFALCLLFALAFLIFGHPVTLIGVFWWITAPLCAVKAVGIFNPPFTVHRFPFAASALYGPRDS